MERRNKQRRLLVAGLLITALSGLGGCMIKRKSKPRISPGNTIKATIFRSVNGTPAENMHKVLELAGGVEKPVGQNDIVVIKPNLQWWNQGSPNIAASEALIESIFERPGFTGEVIIGENTHRGKEPWKNAGWSTHAVRNSDLPEVHTFNDLVARLKSKYGNRFSVCHWIDVGVGGKRIFGPHQGAGYAYCDGTNGVPLLTMDNGMQGTSRRKVIMSYPVFVSDKGTFVDLKNGIWEKGSYTQQPLKFINLSAVNHHSSYCGITSAVKNYFGVTDISYGADPLKGGKLSGDYYNFHAFAFNEWANGPAPGIMGAEIGMFMNTVRKADLNIATAEWVGLSSRTDPPVARTRAVLASTDPVALDYHSAKYLVYPNSGCQKHDPDDEKGPLFRYLAKCAEKSGCAVDEAEVKVVSYDSGKKRFHTDDEMAIFGEIDWGKDPRKRS